MGHRLKIGVSAAGSFTGTCIWLARGSTHLVLDLGRPLQVELPVILPPFQPSAVFLSHAHLGHAGGILEGWSAWSSIPFYAAMPTLDLLSVQLFHNSGHLNSRSMTFDQSFCTLTTPPFFGIPFFYNFAPLSYEPDLHISFFPSGHLYGAAAMRITWNGCRILYLGDWSVNPFGGNPGLPVEMTSCDILITESPQIGYQHCEKADPSLARLFSGWTSIFFSTGARKILVPLQPAGALQEALLDLGGEDWNALHDCKLFLDPFSFAICQAIPPVREKLGMRTWMTPTAELPWYSTREGKNYTELFLCGSASLWPNSPSGKLIHSLANEPDSIVWLGEDALDGSPARALLTLARSSNISANPSDYRVAEFCMPPRKANREDIFELARRIRPREIVFLGHESSSSINDLGSINLRYLNPGEVTFLDRK